MMAGTTKRRMLEMESFVARRVDNNVEGRLKKKNLGMRKRGVGEKLRDEREKERKNVE